MCIVQPMKTDTTSRLLFSSILFLAAACGGSVLTSGISERTSVKSNAATLVLSSWVNLLPKVVSCYMALAGIVSLYNTYLYLHLCYDIPLSSKEHICSMHILFSFLSMEQFATCSSPELCRLSLVHLLPVHL